MKLNLGIAGHRKGMNINELSVPKHLRVRVQTGIDWFDDSIGGEGFVPSQVMMLTGTPGAGKTTLLMQLADSLTGQGHVALYNTGEENLYQVKMVAERLKLKNGFICGDDIMVSDVLEHLEYLKSANKGKQIFLLQDSLQTLDDGKYTNAAGESLGTNGASPMRCTEMLTSWAKTTAGIVVFIGQVNKNGVFNGKNGILHAVDVKAHLCIDTDKKSDTFGERIYEVTKNRYGVSGRSYIMSMGSNGLSEKGS